MRVLSFNLWHGLSPTSPLVFEALEPNARLRMREDLQVDVVRSVNPDFCFFQEVNPIPTRGPELSSKLVMDGQYQGDLVGLKVLGVGLPFNLHSGLAILGARKFGIKFVQAISLSRPNFNWVRMWASWQLKEERFALFCETLIPGVGKVLLVDTHLHHGMESTPEFEAEIDKMVKEYELNSSFVSELKERLRRGDERRRSEVTTLMTEVKRLEKRYSAVVICGDFNAAPQSSLFHIFKEMGFRDAWAEAHADDPGYTFDSHTNQANHLLQARFPLSLVLEDLTFSAKTKEHLLGLARGQETRPRRIDYIWFRSSPSVKLKVTRAELVGKPNAEGLAPSDHFGVMADLELDA